MLLLLLQPGLCLRQCLLGRIKLLLAVCQLLLSVGKLVVQRIDLVL